MDARIFGRAMEFWERQTAGRMLDRGFVRLAHGQKVVETRGHTGVKWVRAVTDTLAAMQQVIVGCFPLSDYLPFLPRPLESPIWAFDDPLPHCVKFRCCSTARHRLGRVTRRSRRSGEPRLKYLPTKS